jgi:nitrilase
LIADEQIHCASWPCKFPFAGFEPWSFTREAGLATSQTYAMEGGTFVVMSTAVMSADGARSQGINLDKSYLSVPGGGCSTIFGPDGRQLSESLDADKEGIV